MVDTVTAPKTGNINDDWEVAVDTGEFDKRLEQEKTRAPNQELAVTSQVNEDEGQSSSSLNVMKSNKPIRILKRPTSQSQLLGNNVVINSASNAANSSTAATNNTNSNTSSTTSPTNSSSSATVPNITIIPRNQVKDSSHSSQTANPPGFVNNSATSQSVKPPIKTYEQRELEYRLARLRIMGEEESSAKDDDDDVPATELNSVLADESNKPNASSISSNSTLTRTNNKMSGISQQQLPLQCHSTPGSYASNLYALNNMPSNTGTIHFTPNHNSTPALGLGPFSSPNFPQHYRTPYSAPYSHMPPLGSSSVSRYPLPTTTTNAVYMTSPPFVTTPSSSSSISSSYHYPTPQHPAMANNNWYHYPPQQTPYGAQQYGHPQ